MKAVVDERSADPEIRPAVYYGPHDIRIDEVAEPKRGSGQLLIDVRAMEAVVAIAPIEYCGSCWSCSQHERRTRRVQRRSDGLRPHPLDRLIDDDSEELLYDADRHLKILVDPA